MPTGKTLAKASLQERIRQTLEQAFQDGHLKPGMPIDEHALARQFKASRTPVREALLLLVAKGLIEIVPRSGIYVRQLDVRELVATMEGLSELEGVLARLAALRIGAAQSARLNKALARTATCAQTQNKERYAQANADLHDIIYEASGNACIVEQTRLLRLRIAPYRGKLFEQPGRLARSHAEHERVVHAICRGDCEGAAEAMRQHILAGGKALTDMVLCAPAANPGGYRKTRRRQD